ncbi:MAG TPA: galactose oxidase-like domain-containing protein [Nitrosospira sp.]|jgi:hypothetical protein|nr:galactose oxidase-like domain-containing protein [Nitrosospira sp.]
MPNRYLEIPDWFSFENQGSNVAIADLNGNGQQDVVVLMMDAAPGKNRGLFRVGRDIDVVGNPTGGWSPWIEIPGWFSFENQGVGIAIGDLDGNGKQDAVVMMIDSPPGRNQGFYRVGKALDQDGTVSGGWGEWIAIPDWFSFENQHGAITLADLDGDGALELVVLAVDNAAQQNRGIYRVGAKLDAQGAVMGGWSEWKDVPGWFPWKNEGAGIATVVSETPGKRDIVIFQIDGAAEQNQAFYKIGKGLEVSGNISGEWGLWRGVPGWFAWANQGGGIAIMMRNGRPEMLVMMVDNPPGKNAGYYRVLPLDKNPQRDGQWELLPFHSDVLAVHAALMPKGKVLFFAGSGSSATRFASHDFGDEAKGIFTSVVWDPKAAMPANFFHPHTIRTPDGKPFDFFCGGDTLLQDGRLLSAGGTKGYNPFLGREDATIFDPVVQQWSFIKPMAHGRWYPTVITLGDSTVLAASGLTEAATNPHNESLEIYSPVTNNWVLHHFPGDFTGLPLYAHMFQLADGRIFFSGGRMDDDLPVAPCIIDLTHNPLQTVIVPGATGGTLRNQSASVLLPPVQDQRVMIMGGGPAGKPNKTDAIDNVDVVDFRQPNPHFEAAAPLELPRLHLNAVLLPDRTVFVTGGSLHQEDAPLARLQSEIYNPATDAWTLTAACEVPRLYHSTALLLPDGRVVTAGGNPEGGTHVEWDKDPEEEMRLEIFSPPYLFNGPRPRITTAPEQWAYGQTVSILSPEAGTLKWAHLIRPCVTTHSFDGSQRLVDLPITSQAGGLVTVGVPGNNNIAPPGWYMLFIVSTGEIPSEATWIQIS